MMSKSIRGPWLLLAALLFVVGVQTQAQSADNGGGEAPAAGEPTPSLGPPVRATASVLRLIRFSGSLSDQLGQPQAGVVGVTFALYAEQEGGAPLWLETQNVTLDPQGRYTVLLGATSSDGLPLEIFTSGEARWLGIQVQGQPEQPRILLVAVPYALKAAEAETLSGKKASDFILNEQLSEQVQKEIETQVQERADSGEIPAAEGEISPQAVTETGRSTFTDTNSTEVVFVEQSGTGFGLRATAPSNSGLRGETTDTTGTPAGVEGVAAANRGRGVYGHTTNASGKNIGVLGESSSVEGTGVFGSALSATGNTTGVRGDAQSTTGVGVFGFARALTGTPTGVLGQTFSQDGIGVKGLASPAGGFAVGVKGESVSNRGRGVHGLASNSAGIVFGVLGETPSTKGRGVYGVATAATGGTVGVRGDTFSLDGTGVTGFARHATGGIAVYGLAIGSSAVAGQFENSGGGKILSGVTSGKSEVFSVDGSGNVTATSFTGDGSALTNLDVSGAGWSLTGNSGTTAGTNFLGTTDNVALELHVNSTRALRLEPTASTPNVIGGFSGNSVTANVVGATIAGGGDTTFGANSITDDFGTVGGGRDNHAGDGTGTTADSHGATVAGGAVNTASALGAFVGGGANNTASADRATIGGGFANSASGARATIGGGQENTASGLWATVPGGWLDVAAGAYSFAAGRRAKANHDGSFVWGDSTDADVLSSAANEVTFRAAGGFRMLDATSTELFTIDGSGNVTATSFSGDGSNLAGLPTDTHALAGTGNTGVGESALANNTGSNNTGLGFSALNANTAGASNTAVGSNALLLNTASDNTAVGYLALDANTTGTSNTALGRSALNGNDTGNNNTAVGRNSLLFNTASDNTAVGAFALDANTSGTSNTAVGQSALGANGGGQSNTAVGKDALAQSTGSGNIAIGDSAGFLLTSGNLNIYLDHGGAASESGTIRIGTSGSHTRAFIAGIDGVNVGTSSAVLINSSGQLGTVSSSRRFKEDIHEMGEASARLLQLRPVSFRYIQASPDGSKPIQYGLIAEEVAEVMPELVVYGSDGQPETVQYHILPALLLNEVQRQQEQIQEQAAELQSLRAELAERVGSLEAELAALKAALEEQNAVKLAAAQPE